MATRMEKWIRSNTVAASSNRNDAPTGGGGSGGGSTRPSMRRRSKPTHISASSSSIPSPSSTSTYFSSSAGMYVLAASPSSTSTSSNKKRQGKTVTGGRPGSSRSSRRSASSSLSRSGSSTLSSTISSLGSNTSSSSSISSLPRSELSWSKPRSESNRSLLSRPRALSGSSQDSNSSRSTSNKPRRAHSDTVSAAGATTSTLESAINTKSSSNISARQKSYNDYRTQYLKDTKSIQINKRIGGSGGDAALAARMTLGKEKTTPQRSKSVDLGKPLTRLNKIKTASAASAVSAAASARLSVPFFGIAIESYSAQRSSEISVDTGDEVRVTDTSSSEHWWYGEVVSKQIQGWLPKSILICDGVPTPREYSSAIVSASAAATSTTASIEKRSAPLPMRQSGSQLSRSVQALVSPANALLRKRSGGREGSFFNQADSQGERKVSHTAVASSTMSSAINVSEPDFSSQPLRRFLSGRGSQWAEYADKEGNIYFHNTNDNEVKWARPTSAEPVRRVRGKDGQAWSEFQTANGSATYWFNERSGEIAHTAPQEERELRTVNSLNGTAWVEHLDDSGSTYWYNKKRQSITYVEPQHNLGDKSGYGGSNTAAPECIICMDRQCCVMLLPCCHANYCRECAERLKECPQCKSLITYRQRFFM
jgi:hypothetical protein